VQLASGQASTPACKTGVTHDNEDTACQSGDSCVTQADQRTASQCRATAGSTAGMPYLFQKPVVRTRSGRGGGDAGGGGGGGLLDTHIQVGRRITTRASNNVLPAPTPVWLDITGTEPMFHTCHSAASLRINGAASQLRCVRPYQ